MIRCCCMKNNSKQIFKHISIFVATIVVSFLIGFIFDDKLWGPLTLIFGFLNSYYMAIGKWQNYIFGIGFTLTYTYICTINGLYGWLIFCVIFYLPVQIYGIVGWFKNKKDETVEMRNFTLKNSRLDFFFI